MYQIALHLYWILLGIYLGARLKEKTQPTKPKKKRIGKTYIPEVCPVCQSQIKKIAGGISKRTKKKYRTFWACSDWKCSFTCNRTYKGFVWSWGKNPDRYIWQNGKPQKVKGRSKKTKNNLTKTTNRWAKEQAKEIIELIESWEDKIDEIVRGKLKMKPPEVTKTDWLEALGQGNYMRIFGGGMFAPTPDEVATSLGISEDELRDKIAQRLNN